MKTVGLEEVDMYVLHLQNTVAQGRFQPQGGPTTGKYKAKEGHDMQVNLSAAGCINEDSGAGGGGYVRPPPPEYCRPGAVSTTRWPYNWKI